jgi:uncharacterized protein GlcG (DUF336 family)
MLFDQLKRRAFITLLGGASRRPLTSPLSQKFRYASPRAASRWPQLGKCSDPHFAAARSRSAVSLSLPETCRANGYAVSVTVVGRNGEIIVQVRGDNTGPHTIENSMCKAYTARTFRSPSGALVERLKADPTLGLIHLTNVIANQGALPIKVGDEVIGAAGASGAPGGEKDEACVKAGIDKVADQLK